MGSTRPELPPVRAASRRKRRLYDAGDRVRALRVGPATVCGAVHTDGGTAGVEPYQPWLEEYEQWRREKDANNLRHEYTSLSSRRGAMSSAAEEAPPPRERRLRYLIARRASNRLQLLTLAATSGKEALPVFGTERAARDFLRHGGWGGAWWVRVSTTGELVSLLLGHLAGVDRVVLDPRPGLAAELRNKKEFIDALMGEPFKVSYTMRNTPPPSRSVTR
jgi:hypothetical protein